MLKSIHLSMAKYYGRHTGYLQKKKLKFRIAVIVSFALVIAIALKVATMETAEYWWLLAAGLALLIYPLILLSEKLNLSAFMVNRGLTGETLIREVLLKLPDGYRVFEDVMFEQARGNVDFIVTGPTGVYAIEVKSHRGNVEYIGGRLCVNHYPKNFLAQTVGEKRAVEDFLNRSGTTAEVVPVLVFSSKSRLKFGFQKLNGVYVFGREYLLELIMRGHNHRAYGAEEAADALLNHYHQSNDRRR